jgi:hypothetical protein
MEQMTNKEVLARKYRKREHVLLLIVEDDERRVEYFKRWNQKANHPDRVAAVEFRFVWARSAGAAIGIIKRDKGDVYDGILLDYDLDQQQLTATEKLFTGKHVVDAVIDNISKNVPILVHSTNPKEGPKMAERLQGAGFSVESLPYNIIERGPYYDWLKYVVDSSERLLV